VLIEQNYRERPHVHTWATVNPFDKSVFGGFGHMGESVKWSRIVSLAIALS